MYRLRWIVRNWRTVRFRRLPYAMRDKGFHVCPHRIGQEQFWAIWLWRDWYLMDTDMRKM